MPRATRDLLCVDGDRYSAHADSREAMNADIGGVLRVFGHAAGPSGAGGPWLVTGHRHQETGAGR